MEKDVKHESVEDILERKTFEDELKTIEDRIASEKKRLEEYRQSSDKYRDSRNAKIAISILSGVVCGLMWHWSGELFAAPDISNLLAFMTFPISIASGAVSLGSLGLTIDTLIHNKKNNRNLELAEQKLKTLQNERDNFLAKSNVSMNTHENEKNFEKNVGQNFSYNNNRKTSDELFAEVMKSFSDSDGEISKRGRGR